MEIRTTPILRQPAHVPGPKKSWLKVWSRRIHIWFGLYLLLFLWLFSISGLLLNHGKWAFAEFWEQREETTRMRPIRLPQAEGDLSIARYLMQQLDLSGEINQIEHHPEEKTFRLQVARPGHIVTVTADLRLGQAEVKQIQVNGWGVFRMLHTFSGVKIDEPGQKRDWLLTSLWSLAMDALAVGLIVFVVTGLLIWYRSKRKKALGWVVLLCGCACCGFFLFGL